MEIPETYLKGFNNGYLLRKDNPVLAKNLISGASGKSEYLEGLNAGSQEYEKEWALNLEEMKKQQLKEKRKDRRMER